MKMKTKTIQWMMCCLMLLIGSDAVAQKEAKKKEAQTTFAVKIMCDNCIKNIKKNIAYEKGVKNLKIDSENQKVTVIYNPRKTNPEKLIEAFKKIGKEAIPIEEVPLKKRQLKEAEAIRTVQVSAASFTVSDTTVFFAADGLLQPIRGDCHPDIH